MTAAELIEVLQDIPPDTKVKVMADGEWCDLEYWTDTPEEPNSILLW